MTSGAIRGQLVTVGELLDGRAVQMPPQAQTSVTFRRADRELPRVAEEQAGFLDDSEPSDAGGDALDG